MCISDIAISTCSLFIDEGEATVDDPSSGSPSNPPPTIDSKTFVSFYLHFYPLQNKISEVYIYMVLGQNQISATKNKEDGHSRPRMGPMEVGRTMGPHGKPAYHLVAYFG
jgi:hypothetical protein